VFLLHAKVARGGPLQHGMAKGAVNIANGSRRSFEFRNKLLDQEWPAAHLPRQLCVCRQWPRHLAAMFLCAEADTAGFTTIFGQFLKFDRSSAPIAAPPALNTVGAISIPCLSSSRR